MSECARSEAESFWSTYLGSPKNPGRAKGGEFQTPYKKFVQPDFADAVDGMGRTVFGTEPNYAKANNVPSINDALLVADSKYLGVLSDEARVISFKALKGSADQVRGMIWLSQFTKGRTFVFLGRVGQALGNDIIEFASDLGVSVTVRTSPLVK